MSHISKTGLLCYENRPVVVYPGAESNCYLKFRKLLFYPLNYQGIAVSGDKDRINLRDMQKFVCFKFVLLTLRSIIFLYVIWKSN